jgi:hypothetical protein
MSHARFARYVGIDYSGAETPNASLKGLRVYLAEGAAPPVEVLPPPSPRTYWSRRGIAEWLVEKLAEDVPTLVGIDHGFSFPLRYFETHGLKPDWPAFLDDFQLHWPTDEDIYVQFVRDGVRGNGAARMGNARWRRLTEERAGSAKSVFHFDVQGSVAKSTHAGVPWLRFIRHRLGGRVHFWPFDGWDIPAGRSAIVEVSRRCGAMVSPDPTARAISMTPSALLLGYPTPTGTRAFPRLATPIFRCPSEPKRRWKDGFWAFRARSALSARTSVENPCRRHPIRQSAVRRNGRPKPDTRIRTIKLCLCEQTSAATITISFSTLCGA